MSVSVFDLFSIGIGPSSSHTVGPMRAAFAFLRDHQSALSEANLIQVDLYGSLAMTGKGHGTDVAIMMGLMGELPDTIDPETVPQRYGQIITDQKLTLSNGTTVPFVEGEHLTFHRDEFLQRHSNGMRFRLFKDDELLADQNYYSIGGGFILNEQEFDADAPVTHTSQLPHPFDTAEELLEECDKHSMTVSEVMFANEQVWRSAEAIDSQLWSIWEVMNASIEHGFHHSGELPGGLKVRRRAKDLYEKLTAKDSKHRHEMNWINLYAISVNEENAAGGRVVTAPTNGAAGVIPAVMKYFDQFEAPLSHQSVRDFLLTAGAIGILYKKGASISAAEVGCQGEVGVACSMAAGALCALFEGTVQQVENAAEMGMEHNLGLTCDPVGGLVQIPCIERNTMGSVQAVNCARLALMEDGKHHVSLDAVIRTMLITGRDMQSKYKETATGGLAVNLPAC